MRRLYLTSPDFGRLRPPTQKYYRILLSELDGIRDMPIQEVELAHIAHIRDRLAEDRPGMANLFVGVSTALFKWALLRGHRKGYNPAHGIPKIPLQEREIWPQSIIDRAERGLTGPIRLAFLLALYAAQRQGDILSMTWAQYDGVGLTLSQSKTGETIYIPCAPALKAALDIAKKDRSAVHIVAGPKGAYKQPAFQAAWRREMVRLGIQGYLFHGLRHTAATRLAEAGCSEREIMAITGHRSSATVSRYVKKAKQRVMAEAAIIKMFGGAKQKIDDAK